MKKSVLASIKPKFCELIASRKKTVEIRKNRPKIEPPFKVYIYCTKGKYKLLEVVHKGEDFHGWKPEKTEFIKTPDLDIKFWHWRGKVIGEFVCDEIKSYECEFVDDDCYEEISELSTDEDGMVSGFIEWSNDCNFPYERTELFKKSCVKYNELKKYIGTKFNEFYAWHISDLVIYDKPKELSEFCKPCVDEYSYCEGCRYGHIKYPEWVETAEDLEGISYDIYCLNRVQRPPQSWCYVEEVENG